MTDCASDDAMAMSSHAPQAERHALLPKTWELMEHYNVGAFVASVEAMLARGLDPDTLLAGLHESMASPLSDSD